MTGILETRLGPLKLKNPVLVASGTFGYGVEYEDIMDISRIGGICVKGISLTPRPGNPPPRVCETPAGMLNAIGLANIGYDAFISGPLQRLRELCATVIVNTYGTSAEEFAELARRFDKVEGIAALEVNISCPNVNAGGIHFGMRPEPAREVTRAVREATRLPIIVKLSPEAIDLAGVAQAVVEAGADALAVMNTIRGMSIDVDTRRPRLGSVMGGLSGPAIRPLAVRLVYEVHKAVSAPIIGIGGVTCLQDALEFFLAGASAVQVGTANYSNPRTSLDIIDDFETYCIEHHLFPSDLTGKVQI
ncbi:MAG: dihydroorotate dehydrogenase [Myxococcota bacterium]|jgi:dihydroorotate dehydrogenase (NAD+) catalytic subunit|nr:dihydroorotate dehydrogenase [Myxococcota bacterium]